MKKSSVLFIFLLISILTTGCEVGPGPETKELHAVADRVSKIAGDQKTADIKCNRQQANHVYVREIRYVCVEGPAEPAAAQPRSDNQPQTNTGGKTQEMVVLAPGTTAVPVVEPVFIPVGNKKSDTTVAVDPPASEYSVPVVASPAPPDVSITVVQPHFITPTPPPFFNNLPGFINSVADGSSGAVRGVFVKNYMAMPAVQQPANDSNWVSSDENQITLFRAAVEHGTIGLLAHNTRGGRIFDKLNNGTTITLVYGDKSTKNFKIVGRQSYQALSPLDPTGDFIDLSTGSRLTAGDVFSRVYAGTYPVVLQTCIENNGNSQWGRLFILAKPA